MNTKQMKYAIELAKTCSFSRASKSLNITQPALSKQIILLEKDLGVKLFDRNFSPLRLTPAGEYFVRESRELLYKEEQLRRSLKSFADGDSGRLAIGMSPFRGLYLIPSIVKKVRERFPGVEVSLYDANSEQIRRAITDGELDFAIINLPVDDSVLEYIPIEPDVLVLAVPNEFIKKIPNAPLNNLDEITFNDCRELPFVVAEPTREMRILFDKLCAISDFRPNIVMEVVGITTAWTMAQSGIGATLVPLQFVGEGNLNNGEVTLFKIKDNNYSRQPAVVTRRGQYLSEYAKFAISLLVN